MRKRAPRHRART